MYRIVPGLHGRQPETASVVCTSGRSRAEACRPCEAQRRPLQTAIVQSGWAMWRLPSRRGAWARATVRSKDVLGRVYHRPASQDVLVVLPTAGR
ncbi:uncharacterized protein LOC133355618 isoform X8 [Lethenteron reissneri]|uniref:uncharacterized protein LOC133355618 isoform X8 n=1 Tax=Lethenteron reissneri TaxID=7753 RepID=UPI002AB6203A|nr:uncharacterized protein LOC133355618 isoform X8 [Lethenteron reissneri]